MELILFLKGIAIGFVMAVPIGPIGVMCIRKTLNEGRIRGLIIGLGAASADLIYSCIAAFGFTSISGVIASERMWIRLVGGTLLLFVGLRSYLAKPVNPKYHTHSGGILGSYFYTVILTLTNPLTIFIFIAIFAALGFENKVKIFSGSLLVTGVFIGSCLWFFLLSSGVTLFRRKLDVGKLRWVNRIAGILIIFSGVIALASLL